MLTNTSLIPQETGEGKGTKQMDKIKNKWQQDRIRHNLTYRSVVKVKWKHESGTLHQAGLITDMRSEQRVSRWRGGG